MGIIRHVEQMEKRVSPRGRTYFWVGDEPLERRAMEPETDVHELEAGYATLTPLHIDMTHRQLLTEVWGPEHADATPVLRTHIENLRNKLQSGGQEQRLIRTDSGIGYRLSG